MPTSRTIGRAGTSLRTKILTQLKDAHKRVKAATAERKPASTCTAPGTSGGTDERRSRPCAAPSHSLN